jgi:hypothetical protein
MDTVGNMRESCTAHATAGSYSKYGKCVNRAGFPLGPHVLEQKWATARSSREERRGYTRAETTVQQT